MNLYDIESEIEQLLLTDEETVVDTETGEIIDVSKRLDELEMAQEDKWENIAKYIKKLDAEVSAIKQEEANLKARRQRKENQIDRLKEYLSNSLRMAFKNKFERASCVLSFRRSEKVNVYNIDSLAPKYLKFKPEPNLTEIKQAINNGEKVEGAELLEKQNLQIK